jgi:hypothetical protein
VQDREILPEGVEDFPVLHFLPVFDFISLFYQLCLVYCLTAMYISRERILVSNEARPSWKPIEIFPAGVWDFSVLPSYRCLILFLINFPILYVFRCLILFLTRHLCFVYIPSKVFPQNCFPLVKLIVDLSIYIHVLALSLRLTFSHPFLPCQCLFPLSKK